MTRTWLALAFLFLLSYLLPLAWSLTHRPAAGRLKVTFLDVGQGDAAVVESPAGRVMVVDTGAVFPDGDNEGDRVVLPFLRHEGINHVDVLTLTHPHSDHIGGAESILREMPVGLVLDNGAQPPDPMEAAILREASAERTAYRAAQRGMILNFGDGTKAEVLSPIDAERLGPANDASVVLRLTYRSSRLLLTGDAEAPEEDEMVSAREPLDCDVLKVGHHGSNTSSTPELLAAAHPQVAVISVGAHNLYGHPSPVVVSRLRRFGAELFRTDQNCAVICISNGTTISATAMNGRPLPPVP